MGDANRLSRFVSLTIPVWGIAIGMTDHSAIRARDPPLPHRLDPFYPQAAASGDLFTAGAE
ncbi:hypothetical protein C9411_17055 [Serratia sp. Nf2]|nr:hypothetical protein C9411_17055 [Serratia sp. Nf2]RZA49072.1 hypothetical protein EVY46_21195 [Serratia marcescens]